MFMGNCFGKILELSLTIRLGTHRFSAILFSKHECVTLNPRRAAKHFVKKQKYLYGQLSILHGHNLLNKATNKDLPFLMTIIFCYFAFRKYCSVDDITRWLNDLKNLWNYVCMKDMF